MLFFMGAANIGVELWKWQQHVEPPFVKATNRAGVAAIKAYL